MTRRSALAALGAIGASGTLARGSKHVFSGFRGTEVHFASVDTGQALLAANDEWMSATSDFQRQTVMGSPRPVTLPEFIGWNSSAVRPWNDEQQSRWLVALQELAPAFASLRIPLPKVVHLVATTGQESSGAPYTRANAVALAGEARVPGYTDAMLLAHELWHVAARHAPEVASKLYAEVGFQPIRPLLFPREWQGIRIANPDAPNNDHAVKLRVTSRYAWATPVLVASRTELRPGETLFNVMDVRLLEVHPGDGDAPSRAVVENGVPIWHRLDGPHDYFSHLGGNTSYVIHYEEAIADNVALLATGGRARNPALLDRLRIALRLG